MTPLPGAATVFVVITAILIALGVPLWVIAISLGVLVFRDLKLRKRPGSIPVRVLPEGQKKWTKGYALWVSDVFAWRGSPAAWKGDVVQAIGAFLRTPNAEERKKLHRLDDDPVLASLALSDGASLEVATRPEHGSTLAGPFAHSNGATKAMTQQRRE